MNGETRFYGQYELIRHITTGGTAEIYLAVDSLTAKTVVLKILKSSLKKDIVAQKKFIREAELQSKINHPNVLKVFDFQKDQEDRWIVQEYFPSITLWQFLNHVQKPESSWKRQIVFQLCEGTASIHHANIIHGDLKPLNVLCRVPEDGRGNPSDALPNLKITDFGEAAIASCNLTTANPIGRPDAPIYQHQNNPPDLWNQIVENNFPLPRWISPLYMSPEQCREERITKASDVYSLGVLFYRLFTGRLPFYSEDVQQMIDFHLNATPPIPILEDDRDPKDLRHLILRCLARNPTDRFSDAFDLKNALRIVYNQEESI